MNSNSNQQVSFYIPRMSSTYDKKQVKAIFKHLNIGKVKRVDFTPLNKKPGFIEIYDTQNKSAFVHMELLYNNDLTQKIFQIVFIQTSGYKIFPENNNMYWLLLKNNYPIQDTMMNKHQIVENCRYLESIVQEQSDTIKNLEEKVFGIQNVVYQLLGGLFSNTQAGIYQEHSNVLFCTEPSLQIKKIPLNTSKWGYKPTTRQGDSNENRIELLESQMKSATKLLFILTGEKMDPCEENEDLQSLSSNTEEDLLEQDLYRNQYHNEDNETTYSYSTHSSMPPLIENYDEADSNSECSLERRRISSELCGNE